MCLVPLTERSSVDLDNRTFDKGVCTHKLVVRCIVHLDHVQPISGTFKLTKREKTYNTNDTGLASSVLRCPRKVTTLQTERTEFGVSTTDTHRVHPLRAELSVRRLATELKLSLLTVVGALGTSCGALVTGATGDSYVKR